MPQSRTDRPTTPAPGPLPAAGLPAPADPPAGPDAAGPDAAGPDAPVADLRAEDLAAGLQLVALDMDGTLLDQDHRMDPGFWAVADALEARGVVLCAASGRQLATLESMFGDRAQRMVLIAENGAHVVHHGRPVSTSVVAPAAVDAAVRTVRRLAAGGERVGAVVSGTRSAYVEREDDAFLTGVARYYARLERVADLLAVDDDVLKVAVHDVGPVAESVYPELAPLSATHTVVLSGEHWVDVMASGTDKGVALTRVQEALGITRERTAAFGDHLNDLEMLDAAGLSFAMANAHPDVRARARYLAPSNRERGVTRTLAALLDLLP
ncbi:Cof-type HAD-IIB family hydrolase [Actinotalea subterranea]|uniref:Cof-type HAD-IIB family hydrolase n=1 Tax=Actinotalea subterranea TaxID=2607497 RepID=UPI001FEC4C52|nr:Cof-type HAD-IIB family hydrolase [Actinotalea subterranea]